MGRWATAARTLGMYPGSGARRRSPAHAARHAVGRPGIQLTSQPALPAPAADEHTIPEPANQKGNRLRRGSKGWTPYGFRQVDLPAHEAEWDQQCDVGIPGWGHPVRQEGVRVPWHRDRGGPVSVAQAVERTARSVAGRPTPTLLLRVGVDQALRRGLTSVPRLPARWKDHSVCAGGVHCSLFC